MTSRKFVVCWLVSVVMFSPRSLKARVRVCLALSPSLPDLVLRTASPSSRYRPMSLPKRFWREFRINSPINSHISAPS